MLCEAQAAWRRSHVEENQNVLELHQISSQHQHHPYEWVILDIATLSPRCGEGNGTPLQYSTPVLLPGKSHGWRSLVGCSPWGRKESDMTERLHFHFALSDIGEGNGNPLQCSCLENPRDGGAWWAAVCGVAQSRPRLKWLSSSINITCSHCSLGNINKNVAEFRCYFLSKTDFLLFLTSSFS